MDDVEKYRAYLLSTGANPVDVDNYIQYLKTTQSAQAQPQSPQRDQTSLAEQGVAGLQAIGQGAALGYIPEGQAAIYKYVTEPVGEFITGEELPDQSYSELRDQFLKRDKELARKYPVTSVAGNIMGGFAVPAGSIAKATTIPGKIALSSAIGGGYGLAMNPGLESQDQTLENELRARLNQAETGVMIGAGAQGLISGGQKAFPYVAAATSGIPKKAIETYRKYMPEVDQMINEPYGYVNKVEGVQKDVTSRVDDIYGQIKNKEIDQLAKAEQEYAAKLAQEKPTTVGSEGVEERVMNLQSKVDQTKLTLEQQKAQIAEQAKIRANQVKEQAKSQAEQLKIRRENDKAAWDAMVKARQEENRLANEALAKRQKELRERMVQRKTEKVRSQISGELQQKLGSPDIDSAIISRLQNKSDELKSIYYQKKKEVGQAIQESVRKTGKKVNIQKVFEPIDAQIAFLKQRDIASTPAIQSEIKSLEALKKSIVGDLLEQSPTKTSYRTFSPTGQKTTGSVQPGYMVDADSAFILKDKLKNLSRAQQMPTTYGSRLSGSTIDKSTQDASLNAYRILNKELDAVANTAGQRKEYKKLAELEDLLDRDFSSPEAIQKSVANLQKSKGLIARDKVKKVSELTDGKIDLNEDFEILSKYNDLFLPDEKIIPKQFQRRLDNYLGRRTEGLDKKLQQALEKEKAVAEKKKEALGRLTRMQGKKIDRESSQIAEQVEREARELQKPLEQKVSRLQSYFGKPEKTQSTLIRSQGDKADSSKQAVKELEDLLGLNVSDEARNIKNFQDIADEMKRFSKAPVPAGPMSEEYIRTKNIVDSKFSTPEKTFKTLSGYDKPSQKFLKKNVDEISQLLGRDLSKESDLLQSYSYFQDPSLLPISSGGTTSTSRTIGLSSVFEAAGGLAGEKGRTVGKAIGNVVGGPAAVKAAAKAERALKGTGITGRQLVPTFNPWLRMTPRKQEK